MGFEITRADVWSGVLEDRPGALAKKLEAVMRAGANLDFVIVRPDDANPGRGVLFLAPLYGEQQHAAAREAGLEISQSIHALRIAGPDRPGLAAGIARTLADEMLSIRGMSAAAVGDRCIVYLRFGSADEVVKASQVLTRKLG